MKILTVFCAYSVPTGYAQKLVKPMDYLNSDTVYLQEF